MKLALRWMAVGGSAALLVLLWTTHTRHAVVAAQAHTPFMIHRFYAGPDGQTHEEDVPADFGAPGGRFQMPISGAVLKHAAPGGAEPRWHAEGTAQYVIHLRGHAQLEIGDGRKFDFGPGDITLVEDTTGKGHLLRVIGNEELVYMTLPLTDQPKK